MPDKTAREPVAKVTGIYRGSFTGLEPLTPDKPLSREEVRRNPIFYELDLNPETGDENLVIDLIYDNMSPQRLPDLMRGTDIPHGIRFWPDWFEIPPYREMRDVDGRRIYPRAPGIHTVQIRTGVQKRARLGGNRDFSPEMRGFTSPVFEFAIAEESHV